MTVVRFIPRIDRFTRPGDPPKTIMNFPVQPFTTILFSLSELEQDLTFSLPEDSIAAFLYRTLTLYCSVAVR
jgi:hypothetical protein